METGTIDGLDALFDAWRAATGLSRGTLGRAIDDGRREGWLVKTGGRGKPASYRARNFVPRTSSAQGNEASDPPSLRLFQGGVDDRADEAEGHEVVVEGARNPSRRATRTVMGMTILGSDLPVPDEVLLVPAMRWLSEHPLAAKTRAALYITNLIEKKAAGLVFNTKMRVRLIDILSERGISAGDLLEANRVTQRANQ